MTRYIDADVAKQNVATICFSYDIKENSAVFSAKSIYKLIDEQPTVEAEPVVELIRCKDCKHHRNRTGRCDVWSANTDADGHCYKAKRNGK